MRDRFLVFMHLGYYPRGGWTDFDSAWPTIEEARKRAKQASEFWQIVDVESLSEVESGCN